jgi:AraC family transcriptional regulator
MPVCDLQFSKRPGGGVVDLDDLKRRSWPGITAHFIRFAAPTAYEFRTDPSANYIALHDIYRTEGETAVSGLPRGYAKDLRNRLSFAPAGRSIEGWARLAKAGSMVAVYFEQDEASSRAVDLKELPPQIGFEDQALRMGLLRFQAILRDPSLDIPGYAETLGELIAFEIYRIASRQARQQPRQGGLTARQARLVTEYMDSHLTDRMTISELAALVGLTRFHFIRSFKQTAGMPPHQFIIRRRIDRAKELLSEHGASIADVAASTGFGSAVQLTRAFRRIVGTTPSAFRADAS